MKINIADQSRRISFLWASGSTIYVITLYILYGIMQVGKSSTFSNTFFSGNAGHWSRLFRKHRVNFKNILEIGSFSGNSARFLIEYFGGAQLTCVDTWAGSNEYALSDFVDIEAQFDRFWHQYRDRVRKVKATSNYFFSFNDTKFDLIYVDGSHFSDDVAVDLINSWAALEVGGIMVCDDYIWQHYRRIRDNPCAAINSFLMLKKGQYRLLAVYRQIWIQKTAASNRSFGGAGSGARAQA